MPSIKLWLLFALLLLTPGTAWATFPTVAATATTAEATDVTTHTFNLPTGIASGHLLIVVAGCRGAGNSFNALTGWTERTDTNSGSTANLWIATRVADGGEGATISPVTTVSNSCAAVAYRITDQHASAAPEVGTPAVDDTGASTAPNPPSLSPSWGAEDTLWLGVGGLGYAGNWTGTPANYTNTFSVLATGSTPGGVGTAQRTLNAASENPGAFTIDFGTTWVANTIAVRPAAVVSRGGMLLRGVAP